FSSRRRHTMSKRDWSSDVCSSDLAAMAPAEFLSFLQEAADGLDLRLVGSPEQFHALEQPAVQLEPSGPDDIAYLQYTSGSTRFQIGRASCRERVKRSRVA